MRIGKLIFHVWCKHTDWRLYCHMVLGKRALCGVSRSWGQMSTHTAYDLCLLYALEWLLLGQNEMSQMKIRGTRRKVQLLVIFPNWQQAPKMWTFFKNNRRPVLFEAGIREGTYYTGMNIAHMEAKKAKATCQNKQTQARHKQKIPIF